MSELDVFANITGPPVRYKIFVDEVLFLYFCLKGLFEKFSPNYAKLTFAFLEV
jgi:hypothetical protein